MANEKLLNNLGSKSIENALKEEIPESFPVMRLKSSGGSVVNVTDENIANNAKFIVNMFDDESKS